MTSPTSQEVKAPKPQKIILDCDPGHDDAIAILLALGNPTIELLAITTVAGNQTLEKVTDNARKVLKIAAQAGYSHNIPVAAGAERPLVAPQIIPEEIHGESGLDGPQLPLLEESDPALDTRHAVNLIADIVRSHEPHTVMIVPTGSLTNIALFARMYPELIDRVQGVTFMGGGHHTGNMTPAAEFNILADPEAAKIVVEAGWPVTMVGLDVTHKVLATPERLQQLTQSHSDTNIQQGSIARFVADLIDFFGAAYMKERHYPGPPMHDPLAVALAADPSLVRTIRAPIHVETHGEFSRGQTIVDLRRTWGSDHGRRDPSALALFSDATSSTPNPSGSSTQVIPPHYVAVDVDIEKFWVILAAALEALDCGVHKKKQKENEENPGKE